MPRRVPLLPLALALALAAGAGAPPAAAQGAADRDAAEARALLDEIATAATKEARLDAAARLEAIGGRAIAPLGEFLARPRVTTPDERRVVLAAIRASVPDKDGRFESPGRQKDAQIRADDEFDWLAHLAAVQPAPPPGPDEPPAGVTAAALGEVLADIAAIRALAASRRIEAAAIILEVGFAPDSMIYRDECGRRLRAMAPASLPALIRGSQPPRGKGKATDRDKALQRYATYQLERLDRQDPAKALAAAQGEEDLQIAILQAFGEAEQREAVRAVFDAIDHEARRVRAAAREAWLAYVSPPHPPPPPKRKLTLPGGKKADTETPLWLNSLQLAEIELRRRTEELFGETLSDRADLIAATRRIFAYHDEERAARDAEVLAEGEAHAAAGELDAAIGVFDRLLAEDPQRPERARMAAVYLARAEALAKAERWAEASAMYSKAHGLDPDGPRATEALAAHYYALGKAQEADGQDGGAAFRRAVELRPDYGEARRAADAAAGVTRARPQWMLYAAGAVALGALALLAAGLRRRPAGR